MDERAAALLQLCGELTARLSELHQLQSEGGSLDGSLPSEEGGEEGGERVGRLCTSQVLVAG